MLIELADYWIESTQVVAVRESSLDSDQTCVWTVGANAESGAFLIDLPVEEVIEALNASHMQAVAERLLEDAEAERLSAAQS